MNWKIEEKKTFRMKHTGKRGWMMENGVRRDSKSCRRQGDGLTYTQLESQEERKRESSRSDLKAKRFPTDAKPQQTNSRSPTTPHKINIHENKYTQQKKLKRMKNI